MGIKTILFDFDGTLADTLPLTFLAFQSVFREFDGRELSDQDIIAMFGPEEVEILNRNLRNRERLDEAVERYYGIYADKHREAVKEQTQIGGLLRELKEQGYCLAVYTGKSRRSYEISMSHLGWAPLFDLSLTGNDVERAKPDPEGILLAMVKLASAKEETIYVGDSEADIEAGHRAGVKTVGVHWMPTHQSPEFKRKPDAHVGNPEAFKRFLAEQSLQ